MNSKRMDMKFDNSLSLKNPNKKKTRQHSKMQQFYHYIYKAGLVSYHNYNYLFDKLKMLHHHNILLWHCLYRIKKRIFYFGNIQRFSFKIKQIVN